MLKVPRKRKGIRQIRYGKKYINMETAIPIPGGFRFNINGVNVEYSTLELGFRREKKKKMICSPPALNIERNTIEEQDNCWNFVINNFNPSILRAPTTYGSHNSRVGAQAKEIFLGSYKDVKKNCENKITKATKKHLNLVHNILGSLSNRAKLIYPRIAIITLANTIAHVDKVRSSFPQYMRILKDDNSKEYGLRIDERIYFGKTMLALSDGGIGIPITYRENKHGSVDKDIRLAKFVNNEYVGTVVIEYDSENNFEHVLSKRIGNLKYITLICGNESVIKYYYDDEIFENTKDLFQITPRIFRICSKGPKKICGSIKTYGSLQKWEKIFPNRYIHWWYGDITPVRVYIINASLRTPVGDYSVLHV